MIEKLLAAKPDRNAMEAALWHFVERNLLPSAEEVLAWCALPIPEDQRWITVAFCAASNCGPHAKRGDGLLAGSVRALVSTTCLTKLYPARVRLPMPPRP